jgi:hypothetical protein
MSETNQIPNQIKPFAFDLAVDKQKAIGFNYIHKENRISERKRRNNFTYKL